MSYAGVYFHKPQFVVLINGLIFLNFLDTELFLFSDKSSELNAKAHLKLHNPGLAELLRTATGRQCGGAQS